MPSPLPAEEQRLRAVFRRALREALAPGLALGLLACGASPLSHNAGDAAATPQSHTPDAGLVEVSTTTPTTPTSTDAGVDMPSGGPFIAAPCGDGGVWNSLAGLNPAQAVDYIGFRQGFDGKEFAAQGQACATAVAPATCQQAVTTTAATVGSSLCTPGGCSPFFIVTVGDMVSTITSQAQLVAFLGTIDNAQEARLVATFDRFSIFCDDPTRGGVRAVPGGFELRGSKMIADCPVQYADVILFVSEDGSITVRQEIQQAPTGACVGRRPEGLLARAASGAPGTVGSFLATCATLEAASVNAFIDLGDDLAALGAPYALVHDARRFADDEIRHAAVMTTLAEHHGGCADVPIVRATPRKSLRALALENAVEGCVRETFGALVAEYQSRAAADQAIASVMARIADDETRHAALAWRIAAWAEPLLTPNDREAMRAAQRAAVAELRAELAVTHAGALHDVAGWPRPAQGVAMANALDAALWS